MKDRASYISVARAKQEGKQTIAVASTGNAAASLACLCAGEGMESVVYVPKNAPLEKIIQSQIYGARIVLYDGSYDDAYDVCLLDSAANGWYNRCTGYNPYMTEGKKTVAYEIAEQLGWNVPDRVFVSVGDGSIIGALYKGFYDLLQLGWTKKIPKLMGVQAQGSAYFYDAVQNNEDVVLKHKIKSQTLCRQYLLRFAS